MNTINKIRKFCYRVLIIPFRLAWIPVVFYISFKDRKRIKEEFFETGKIDYRSLFLVFYSSFFYFDLLFIILTLCLFKDLGDLKEELNENISFCDSELEKLEKEKTDIELEIEIEEVLNRNVK